MFLPFQSCQWWKMTFFFFLRKTRIVSAQAEPQFWEQKFAPTCYCGCFQRRLYTHSTICNNKPFSQIFLWDMLTNYVPQQKTTVVGKDFWNLRIQIYIYIICPKKRNFPCNPILGMGCFDHQSYDFREGSGFLDFIYLYTLMVDVYGKCRLI